ncbi:MAG: 30S ribosomal protein S4 [Nitrospirae bacterium]|nr:MAG: 30S ribosomal protein S4 [Nitrospirota bacterium]
MANYLGPVCRICRREGVKLFLKGTRCMTEKCAIERRSYPPGQHGQNRTRVTDYSIQLREKQKLRRMYGVLERQFRGLFRRAERQPGVTGENLLSLLERRLDNVVYRLGFAQSRRQARQLVTHGHVLVNGRKSNIPSMILSVGDVVELKDKSRQLLVVQAALDAAEAQGVVSWLELDREACKGTLRALPTKEEIRAPVNEQVVVELYSR